MKFWLRIDEYDEQLKNRFRISKEKFTFEITLTGDNVEIYYSLLDRKK